jgi:hypothetical protein
MGIRRSQSVPAVVNDAGYDLFDPQAPGMA